MSTALLDSPMGVMGDPRDARGAGRRRMTLAERLDREWRVLQAEGRAQCPACHGPMHLSGGAGRCGGCGAVLS
jgi:hypothetical protein